MPGAPQRGATAGHPAAVHTAGPSAAGNPAPTGTTSQSVPRRRFAAPAALHAYRAYFALLYGHVLNELQESVADPDETEHLLRLGLHRLPTGQFPVIRQLAAELSHYNGAVELELGLDMLMIGLQAQLNPKPKPQQKPW